jgi:hypothetical protein
MENLNSKLFEEIYPSTIENLQMAFEEFKKSLDFAIMQIDGKR